MSRVTESPTANLYALLADEADQPQRKARAAANKGQAELLTPKERAEAKAVQEAERKAKREAELKAKQEQEAARKSRAALELVNDDTGFSQQRHQRIKESRVQERPTEGSPKPKGEKGPKGPKNNNKGPKDQSKDGNVTKYPKGDKPAKVGGSKQPSQGHKAPRTGRDFDKHSQGVISRKPAPKKGGHGRGNWDKEPTVAAGTDAEEVAASAVNTEVSPSVDVVPSVEGEVQAEAAVEGEAWPTAEDNNEEEEDEEAKWETYEAHLAKRQEQLKELEAKFGSASAQPRSLTDDEKKALTKFTAFENTKKTVAKKAAEPAKKEAAHTKKETVLLETNFSHPPVEGARRGPRVPRDNQRGNRENRDQKKGGRVAKPAKLPKGGNFDTQFPSLG